MKSQREKKDWLKLEVKARQQQEEKPQRRRVVYKIVTSPASFQGPWPYLS